MARKKEAGESVLAFTKEQIVASKKYAKYKDFLQGNLQTGQTYSFAELDALILKNYGKEKGE